MSDADLNYLFGHQHLHNDGTPVHPGGAASGTREFVRLLSGLTDEELTDLGGFADDNPTEE